MMSHNKLVFLIFYYLYFGIEVNQKINSEVIRFFRTIREKNIEGINNLTPSYNKLIISYDLKLTNFKIIKEEIEKLTQSETSNTINKNLEIPVCCDVSLSLDMERLEKKIRFKKR
jgi:allophanate hydrolase subunit 1